MKISIKTIFGIAEVNEELEMSGNGSVTLLEKIQEVKEVETVVPEIAFLYFELKQEKEFTIEADEELQELLLQLNEDVDENVIY